MGNTNHLKTNKITSYSKEEGLVLSVNSERPIVIDLFSASASWKCLVILKSGMLFRLCLLSRREN